MMKNVLREIKKHKSFLLSTHVNPDPDGLCSELALAAFLRSLGKRVRIVNPHAAPARFKFLPGFCSLKHLKPETRMMAYDAAIVLDTGDLDRLGKMRDFLDFGKPLINIDHHITNTRFGSVNLIDAKASSTAELLFVFLKHARARVTKSMAYQLYAGMLTDTGSFRYENTTPRTHRIAAELMSSGINASRVFDRFYQTVYPADLKALKQVLSKMETFDRGRIVFVDLRKSALKKFSESADAKDMVFNTLRSLQGTEVFVIFTEVSAKKTRINLRSSGSFNVARIAGCFNGGGHKGAAGCMISGPIDRARKDILKAIRKS